MQRKENEKHAPKSIVELMDLTRNKFLKSQELVPVLQEDNKMFVDSRLLHKALGVATHHRDWIRRRIHEYGFSEPVDYRMFLVEDFDRSNLSDQVGGHGGDRRSAGYLLSVDMAKELSMVEKTDMGRVIRRYFISLEEQSKIGFVLPKLIMERTLFDYETYFDYVDLVRACGYSVTSGSFRSRIRKNPQEFIKNQQGDILITERYGKTIQANAIVRKLNEETKQRRLLNAANSKGGLS